MRILEHGLGALARSVKLNFDIQQWHTIIEQIEAKIAELRKTLPRGSDRSERMQFLSEAAKEFFILRTGGETMCLTITVNMTSIRPLEC